MLGQQFEQPRVGGLHLGLLLLARLALAVVEMVDIHVVVMQRPAGSLRFGKIGIAVGGMQPGAANVERHAEMLVAGPGAAADAAHGFEQLEGKTCGTNGPGGSKPAEPAPMMTTSTSSMAIPPATIIT